MKYEEKVVRKIEEYHGGIRLICDTNYALGTKAQAALDLCKNLALAMCQQDGESNSGQQTTFSLQSQQPLPKLPQLTLMDPDAVAERACDIVEYLFREFERREWLLEVPELEAKV